MKVRYTVQVEYSDYTVYRAEDGQVRGLILDALEKAEQHGRRYGTVAGPYILDARIIGDGRAYHGDK